MYQLRYDPSDARLALARREADVALRLWPRTCRRRISRWVWRATSCATTSAGLWTSSAAGCGARRTTPSCGDGSGGHTGTSAQWDSVMVAFDRARSLDPRDADLFVSFGDAYHYRHRYREAIAAYRQALALAPDLVEPRLAMAWSYVLWQGELDTLRAVLRGPAAGRRSGRRRRRRSRTNAGRCCSGSGAPTPSSRSCALMPLERRRGAPRPRPGPDAAGCAGARPQGRHGRRTGRPTIRRWRILDAGSARTPTTGASTRRAAWSVAGSDVARTRRREARWLEQLKTSYREDHGNVGPAGARARSWCASATPMRR